MSALPAPGSSTRTTVHRSPKRSIVDRDVLHAILDAGLVAHVAVVDDAGQPFVLPVAYARADDSVIIHGSTASRLFRGLAQGRPTCVTVTLLDGVVFARSAFNSSMNYRSVMVLGVAEQLTGDAELAALQRIADHLTPGRWDVARKPSAKERAATMTLRLSLDECSIKVRTGGPNDDEEDILDPEYGEIWAGTLPMAEVFGEPIPDQYSRHRSVPPAVLEWRR